MVAADPNVQEWHQIKAQLDQIQRTMVTREDVEAMITARVDAALGDRPTRTEMQNVVNSALAESRELLTTAIGQIKQDTRETLDTITRQIQQMQFNSSEVLGKMAGVREVVDAYRGTTEGIKADVRVIESGLRMEMGRLDEEQKKVLTDVTDMRGGLRELQDQITGDDGIRSLLRGEILPAINGLRASIEEERRIRLLREAEEARRAERTQKVLRLGVAGLQKFASLPMVWRFVLPAAAAGLTALGLDLAPTLGEILAKLLNVK